MAARFPQSGSSVAYKIATAYAGKVVAVWWAASADSMHRLFAGDTASTIITRSTSGAGFDSGNGTITGTIEGASSGQYFSDYKSGGLGLTEDAAFGLGFSAYGDIYNGVGVGGVIIGTGAPLDIFDNKSKIQFTSYDIAGGISSTAGSALHSGNIGDDVRAWMNYAMRYNPSDPIQKLRYWVNGSEDTGERLSATASSSANIGDASNPVYFGGSKAGTGNTSIDLECVYIHTGLSDAELATITADTSVLIEAAGGGGGGGAEAAARNYYAQLRSN